MFNLGTLLNRQPMPMQPPGAGGGYFGGQAPISGPMPVTFPAHVQSPGNGIAGGGPQPIMQNGPRPALG